jgi:hypothetical protein
MQPEPRNWELMEFPHSPRTGVKSRFELDCNTPRVCAISECSDGSNVETLYGVQANQWSDVRVRRSMTISGKVLFDIAMGIHFNRWPVEATKEI